MKCVVSEGQKLGALAVLLLSIVHYGALHIDAGQSGAGGGRGDISSASLQWGRPHGESIAIEISGSRSDGIYFVPRGTRFEKITEISGIRDVGSGPRGSQAVVSEGALFELSDKGAWVVKEMPAGRMLALGLRLDVNRVSEEDLLLVPGVGEKTAAAIIGLRKEKGQFRDISELAEVSGIKEKRLAMLKDYLAIKGAP